MIYTSMKKKIFSIIFVCIAIACNFNAFGQCDNPPMCDMNDLTFTPLPDAIMSLPTFNLDCSTTTIEANFGAFGANNINYTWYDSNNIPVSNDDELTAPIPGNYTLEVDYMLQGNSICCAQEITVNPWRAEDVSFVFRTQGANAVEVNEICIGESVNLLSVPNTYCSSYIWTFPDGSMETSSDAGTDFTPTMPGINTVTLQVIDGTGNIATAGVNLMVNELPNLTVTATPTVICEGNNVIVSAVVPPPISAYTYVWNTGQMTSDFSDTPTQNTNYEVEVTDMNGCKSTGDITVEVNPAPDATIINGDLSICLGDNITLMTTENGATYLWSNGDTGQSTATITPTETNSYSVTVTKGGCSTSDTVTVTVIQPEDITIQGENEICAGESTTLTAPQADTYIWSTGAETQSITVSPIMDENFNVTITNSGCISTGQVSITIKPAPTATITGNTEICEGQSTTLTAGGGNSYTWSTNETTPSISISPTSNQSYTVTVTASNGCTDVESRIVNVTSVSLNISGNTTICNGESTMLMASSGGTYLWSTNATTQSIMVSPTTTSTYEVTKTVNDCSLTEEVTVNVNPTYEEDITETICPGDSYMVGNNTYTQTGEYSDVLSTLNGCDSTINLSLTVQPIPSFQFLQDSLFGSICSAQTITVDVQDGLYDFVWRAPDNDNVIVGDGCTALSIQDDPATFFLDVSANGCTATSTFNINLNAAPTNTKVFLFGSTNTLFCNRSDFDSYQWGKEKKDTLCAEPMAGETFQDVVVADLDTDTYYYWVIVNEGTCTHKVYLNGDDNSPFGKLVADPNIEYGDLALQINPNPNNGAFELSITGDEVRDLDVHIYDALGRMIYQQDVPKIYSVHTHYIAVPKLTQGVYFVRVTGNNGILLTEKIIVK